LHPAHRFNAFYNPVLAIDIFNAKSELGQQQKILPPRSQDTDRN
jgi:hypothetical protein